MKDLILGIDPGLGKSHAALLRVPDVLAPAHAPKYDVVEWLSWDTKEEEDALPLALPDKYLPRLAFVAVESARGVVVSGRSADPVLRNAMMSGRLQQAAALAFGVPVGSVPALGVEQGWNWRGLLGCAGQSDAGVRLVVERRLLVPPKDGKRGGKVSHFVDAAGIAVAAADRLLGKDTTLSADPAELRRRWYALNHLEQHVVEAKKDMRAGRRQARALQKRYG